MSHPIIGQHYAGPPLDRVLRQMPRHWTLEETRHANRGDKIVLALSLAILAFGLLSACGAFAADKPTFPKAQPYPLIWTQKRCAGQTYLASPSDGRKWNVRCTGKRIRT